MIDPLSLSAVGAVAITEGIKFLYDQTGEVLKRWRERKDSAKNASTQLSKTEPIEVKLPAHFAGQLIVPQIHFDVVERLEGQMRELRKDLSDYADGIEIVDATNVSLLRRVDALRQVVETVFQQHLTFKGEQRTPSGPLVESRINVEEVAGYVAAVRARRISGDVRVDAQARRVDIGSQFIGVDADTIE